MGTNQYGIPIKVEPSMPACAGTTGKMPVPPADREEQRPIANTTSDNMKDIFPEHKAAESPLPQDIDRYLLLADQCCQKQDYLQASKYYEEALKISPDSIEAIIGLGTALGMLDRFDDAIEHLKRATVTAPKSSEAYNNLGCVYFQKERINEAEECFRKALELDGHNAEARRNLADLQFERGNYDDALSLCEQILIGNPTDAQSFVVLGNCYLKKGALDPATMSYEKALEINPDYDDAKHNLEVIKTQQALTHANTEVTNLSAGGTGILPVVPAQGSDHLALADKYCEEQNYQEALRHYEEALKTSPDSIEAATGAGITLGILKRFDEAIKYLERVTEIAPNSSEAHNNLGCIYFQKGKMNEAEECFKKALDIDNLNSDAKRNLADLYFEISRYDEAVSLCEQLLIGNPNDAQSFVVLGNCYHKKGAPDVARMCYEKALEIAPDYDDARYNLEMVKSCETSSALDVNAHLEKIFPQLSEEERKEATETIEKLEQNGNGTMRVMHYIGKLYERVGQSGKAEKLYKEIVERDPNIIDAYYSLSDLYRGHDKLQEADAILRRLLNQDIKQSPAWNTLGMLRLATNDLEGARLCFTQASHFDPNCADYKRNLDHVATLEKELMDRDNSLPVADATQTGMTGQR